MNITVPVVEQGVARGGDRPSCRYALDDAHRFEAAPAHRAAGRSYPIEDGTG